MGGAVSYRLVSRAADDILFRLKGLAITAAMFLDMARTLANELPDGRFVVNLCNDRLQFAVGLAAALMRNQVNLLTSDRSPERLRSLHDRYPDVYSLSDDPTLTSPLRHHHHRAQPPRPSSHQPENPQIAAGRLAAIVFTSGSTGVPMAHEKS